MIGRYQSAMAPLVSWSPSSTLGDMKEQWRKSQLFPTNSNLHERKSCEDTSLTFISAQRRYLASWHSTWPSGLTPANLGPHREELSPCQSTPAKPLFPKPFDLSKIQGLSTLVSSDNTVPKSRLPHLPASLGHSEWKEIVYYKSSVRHLISRSR